ncbi:MAG: ribbon-helix-helix domain-containing protein [Gammaproteobacteria bacterium]|nr:ribbon-helix-helix domain-containing protein [Gammaproteobacteria bacterium]
MCIKVLHRAATSGRAWGKVASKHRVSVNLSPDEHRELAALAESARVSKAWLGRRAITEFLERSRDGQLQLPLNLVQAHQELRPQ